jgi:hypothetical protein
MRFAAEVARDGSEEKSMSSLPPQERRLSCLDQFRRGERASDKNPDHRASPYDSFPPPTIGESRVKEALKELERQNEYLRALVVSLSETIVRQLTAKT